MRSKSCEEWHPILVRPFAPASGTCCQLQFYTMKYNVRHGMQVRECAKLANASVAAGMCVVIGLQSTGEANTNQARDEEGDVLDDFISAPKKILHLFITRHFPTGTCDMQQHELDLLQHQVHITMLHTPLAPALMFASTLIRSSQVTIQAVHILLQPFGPSAGCFGCYFLQLLRLLYTTHMHLSLHKCMLSKLCDFDVSACHASEVPYDLAQRPCKSS